MPQLNQIIALLPARKKRATATITALHHGWKSDLLQGLTRTYEPLDDKGQQLPPESKLVQLNVDIALNSLLPIVEELIDTVATQDMANCSAKAAVVLADGTEVLPELPVAVLLFLAKQLIDLRTLITGLPVLPSEHTWHADDARGCFATEPVKSLKTAKVPTPLVLAEATKEHPAQVQVQQIDTPVGTWTNVRLSGAMEASRKTEMLQRVIALQDALKCAREKANTMKVEQVVVGRKLIGHIFGE